MRSHCQLMDEEGGKKSERRENKNFWAATSQESVWETDTDVEIQITHSPANHAAHQGGEG